MELHTLGIDLAVFHLVAPNLRGEDVGGRLTTRFVACCSNLKLLGEMGGGMVVIQKTARKNEAADGLLRTLVLWN